jgi:hypothetical protein
MRHQASVKKDSAIKQVIAGSALSEHERQRSLEAMRQADLFADGLLWTMHKIEDFAHLFGKSEATH